MADLHSKLRLPSREAAPPGRSEPMAVSARHYVNGHRLSLPFPQGTAEAMFGMGCFWGAERIFWRTDGVWTTAVGYAGGYTPNPTYEEVCTGLTGHTEAVLVVFDPSVITLSQVLKVFWENHDPTTPDRQGNDVGTQYRSAIYYADDAQREVVERSREQFQEALSAAGHGEITTEIAPLGEFYYAEGYHQQYLSESKNPNGYCGIDGTGVSCPIGLGTA